MGLSIVSSLARLLGGEVGVDSQLGQGSRFWFRVRAERSLTEFSELPTFANSTENASNSIAFSACHKRARGTLSGHILVVEDNAVNCLGIEGLLEKLGLQVHQVHDDQQALFHFQIDRSLGAKPQTVQTHGKAKQQQILLIWKRN